MMANGIDSASDGVLLPLDSTTNNQDYYPLESFQYYNSTANIMNYSNGYPYST